MKPSRIFNFAKKQPGLCLTAFILLFLSAGVGYPGLTNGTAGLVKIEKVNDGDTVTIRAGRNSERLRLIGIDAPELGQEPWGEISKKYLANIIASSSGMVKLEYDVERRDKYGRMLAYLWTKDGKLVNRMMVEDGYALLFTFPPNVKHAGELVEAYRKARESRSGLWGRNGFNERPYEYRKKHPRIN